MKKIIFALLVIMLAIFTIGFSQEPSIQLFIGDRHPLSWDLEPEPANGTQTYEVCVWDRIGEGDPIVVDEVSVPPVTVNISAYDFRVTFGVRTVLTLSQDAVIENIEYQAGDRISSEWNFSHINGVMTPNPFVASRDVHAPGGFKHG